MGEDDSRPSVACAAPSRRSPRVISVPRVGEAQAASGVRLRLPTRDEGTAPRTGRRRTGAPHMGEDVRE